MVKDLVDSLIKAKVKIKKRRMRPIVDRIRGEIISIISIIIIIGIKEVKEKDKDQEEEAFLEHVFTMKKKIIWIMNVLNAKE